MSLDRRAIARRRSPPGRARHEPVAVLLAAGASRRLGFNKALLSDRGAPLVVGRIRALKAAGLRDIRVVVGRDWLRVARTVRRAGARPVRNPDWRAGMAGSLAKGLGDTPPGTRCLIAAVDQYRLRAEDYRRIVARTDAAGLRASAAASPGGAGVPVMLPARWRAPLLRARPDPDHGARRLLRARARAVNVSALPRARDDLDRPADLRPGRHRVPRDAHDPHNRHS